MQKKKKITCKMGQKVGKIREGGRKTRTDKKGRELK